MTRETFTIGTDAHGRRFIYKAKYELGINHNENNRTFKTIDEASIYEVPGSPKCPVQNYLMYFSALNPNRELFGKTQKHQ